MRRAFVTRPCAQILSTVRGGLTTCGVRRFKLPKTHLLSPTKIRTGVRPDGRALSPVMPWPAYAGMRQADVYAIAVFLKTLPPVKRHIPGPFKANEKTTTFRWRVIPPDGLAAAAP